MPTSSASRVSSRRKTQSDWMTATTASSLTEMMSNTWPQRQEHLLGMCLTGHSGPYCSASSFQSFPVRNRNKSHVSKDPETGEIAFIETKTGTLAGVEKFWHPVKMNELNFAQKQLRQRVRVATHPKFNDGKPVLIKLAVEPWEIASMETETTVGQYICDRNIGPRFLGHLIEGKGGRVVGIAVERVEDARIARPGDLESCRKVLGQLHELGIKHGDTNKHNFLEREGHDVLLIDFEATKKCSPQELGNERPHKKRRGHKFSGWNRNR